MPKPHHEKPPPAPSRPKLKPRGDHPPPEEDFGGGDFCSPEVEPPIEDDKPLE